jgi:hypothetical protein
MLSDWLFGAGVLLFFLMPMGGLLLMLTPWFDRVQPYLRPTTALVYVLAFGLIFTALVLNTPSQ